MQMMAKYEIDMMVNGTPVPGTVAAAGSAGIHAAQQAVSYGAYGSMGGQYGGMYGPPQPAQYGYYGMQPQAPVNVYGQMQPYPTQAATAYGKLCMDDGVNEYWLME